MSPGIPGTPDFKPLAVSGSIVYGHFSVVLADGSVWEWGFLGGSSQSDAPILVAGLDDITSVSAGGYHRLALGSDGRVWTWGANDYGQLGNGSPLTGTLQAPAPELHLSGMTAVAAGGIHSLALSHDGTVWAWGDNSYGQLGNGSTGSPVTVPAQVPGLSGIIAIIPGQSHS